MTSVMQIKPPSKRNKRAWLEWQSARVRAENRALSQLPKPRRKRSTPVWKLVIADMRNHIQEYGTPLQANNGRDALHDAYEEALDLCVYLRQAIEERGA